MNIPKISCIVPVYKVEKYLPECIESIIAQTFKDWELILIEDGSPDFSGKICDAYATSEKRIKVIHKKNEGVSVARNVGLANATGEWITFIDSDDYISPNFFSGLYKVLLENSNIDFVQGGCLNYYSDKKITIEQKYRNIISNEPVFLLNNFRGLAVSKLFKKDIIDLHDIHFDESMKIAEDMAFTMSYIKHVKRYAFVDEVGYYYRHREDSATVIAKYKDYSQEYYSAVKLYNYLKEYLIEFKLQLDKSPLRRQQRADGFFVAFLSLYKGDISKDQKINHIKIDFTIEYRQLMKFANRRKLFVKLILYLMDRGAYNLLDFVVSLVFKFR